MELQKDIDHAREVTTMENVCAGFREEHGHPADWLEELKSIREILGDYDLDRLRKLVKADREGRVVVLLSNDDVYTIRGDIMNGIIKANCRDACKPPKPR